MSTIESVHVSVARVPLDKVTSFATRTVSARDYCLVKVRSTDGVEGIGFCYVGSTRRAHRAGGASRSSWRRCWSARTRYRVEGLWQRDVPGGAAAGPRRQRDARDQHPRHRAVGPECAQRPGCRCTSTSAAPHWTRCRPTPAAAITWTARRRRSWAQEMASYVEGASRR